jgi:hypothetical protein
MTTLLVLTTGKTDVQLVVDGVRYELEPRKCGVLHDEIERRGYRLVDAPPPADTPRKMEAAKPYEDSLPDGELTLCTPKLDAVLRFFDGISLPDVVLIFETRRELPSDPRLAGSVLERRLRGAGIGMVHRHALLTGTDYLDDQSVPDDAVVRRVVVNDISQQLAKEFSRSRPDSVVVATTGGFPAVNAVIEELVRLHSVGNSSVQILETPDGKFGNHADRAVPEKFHPAAGYRARWHALSLIEGGHLLGAWGAVSHLTCKTGQEWTRIIDWLRCFASSLPMPGDCNVPVLKHPRMAVRTALRVELALRADDIPKAVHGTVAFFEAALWDCLRERDFVRDDGVSSGDLERGFAFNSPPTGEKKQRFKKRKNSNAWRIDDYPAGIAAWLSVLSRPKLVVFWGKLSDDIRELRNDVAHNTPTPRQMDEARGRMQAAALWSADNTFLSQHLVQDLLVELGETEPSKLLESLLTEVRRRLVAPLNSVRLEMESHGGN